MKVHRRIKGQSVGMGYYEGPYEVYLHDDENISLTTKKIMDRVEVNAETGSVKFWASASALFELRDAMVEICENYLTEELEDDRQD